VNAVDGRRIICCVGSGGVGKTTTAAALALGAAVEGRRALVLTIDPARRLANSLGLRELGNAETRIEADHFAEAHLSVRGEMWAMMLDLKRTWDDLVTRSARNPGQAQAILGNKLYQTLSTVMAGSLEYMAMEKVYEVYSSGRFDVIVLDTPPTSNALDFLHAPDRILDVLDNNAMRIVLGPMLKAGKVGFRLLAAPSSLVLRTLARFTGSDFLRDLAAFMMAFEGMYEGFKERAAKVKALLSSSETGFVLVTSPNPSRAAEGRDPHRRRGGQPRAAGPAPPRWSGHSGSGEGGTAARADQGREGAGGAPLRDAHRAGHPRRHGSARSRSIARHPPRRSRPHGPAVAQGRARPGRIVADRRVPGR
jgi:anion-transporting  ArsA/GET3 family ATPase